MKTVKCPFKDGRPRSLPVCFNAGETGCIAKVLAEDPPPPLCKQSSRFHRHPLPPHSHSFPGGKHSWSLYFSDRSVGWFWFHKTNACVWILVSLSVSLSPPPSLSALRLHQLVVHRPPPPGDLWFMGTPVSHNKAVSNEVKEGDLFVHTHICARNWVSHPGTCALIYKSYISKWWMTSSKTLDSSADGRDTGPTQACTERWHWNGSVRRR